MAEHVVEITCNFEFVIRQNSCDVPERYQIELSIRSYINSFEKFVVNISSGDKYYCGVMIVHYSHYVIGKNLTADVQNWYKSLPVAPRQFDCPKVKKFVDEFRALLPRVSVLSSIVFSYGLASYMGIQSFSADAINWALISLAFYTCFFIFSIIASRRIYKHVMDTVRLSFFKITRGDENRIEKHIENNQKLVIRARNWFAAISLGICSSIFGGVVLAYIGIS